MKKIIVVAICFLIALAFSPLAMGLTVVSAKEIQGKEYFTCPWINEKWSAQMTDWNEESASFCVKFDPSNIGENERIYVYASLHKLSDFILIDFSGHSKTFKDYRVICLGSVSKEKPEINDIVLELKSDQYYEWRIITNRKSDGFAYGRFFTESYAEDMPAKDKKLDFKMTNYKFDSNNNEISLDLEVTGMSNEEKMEISIDVYCINHVNPDTPSSSKTIEIYDIGKHKIFFKAEYAGQYNIKVQAKAKEKILVKSGRVSIGTVVQ